MCACVCAGVRVCMCVYVRASVYVCVCMCANEHILLIHICNTSVVLIPPLHQSVPADYILLL